MQRDSYASRECSLDKGLGYKSLGLHQEIICLYEGESRGRGRDRGWNELVKNLLFDFKLESFPKFRNGTRLLRVNI